MLTTQSREAAAKQFADEGRLPVLLEPGNPFALRPKAFIPSDLAGEEVTVESPQDRDIYSKAAEQLGSLQERRIKAVLGNATRYPNHPEVLNNVGLALLNAGRIPEAEEYFARALALEPRLLQARANLAKAYSLSGRHTDALGIYEEILREDPSNTTALMNSAQIQAMQGRFADAEITLTHVIRINGENAAVWTNRGLVRLARRRLDEAISDLRKATRIAVRNASAHNGLGVAYALRGSTKKAIRAFKAALTIDPLNEDATKNLARLYLETGGEEAAFDLLDTYLIHADEDIEARNLIARSCFLLERLDIGIRHLNKALKIAETKKQDGQLVSVLNNLGVLTKAKGNYSDAREFYESAIEDAPKELLPRQNLVDLMIEQGHFDSAQAELDECFRIKPEDSQNFSLQGALLAWREEYQESIQCLYKAIALDPRNPRPYGWLTVVMGDVFEKYTEVIRRLEETIKYHPNDRMMLNNLAYAYLMADDARAARRILDRIDPRKDNAYLTATRGLLFIKEGNLPDGRRWYNLAAQMARTRELRSLVEQKKSLELARYFLAQGQTEEAKKHLLIGVSIRTKDPRYRRAIQELQGKISS